MFRGLRVRRASGSGPGGVPTQRGHVTIMLEPTPDAPPALLSPDWDRMHTILAAWKARSLLTEAQGHMQPAVEHSSDPHRDFTSSLDEALAATMAALQALDRIR